MIEPLPDDVLAAAAFYRAGDWARSTGGAPYGDEPLESWVRRVYPAEEQ